MDPDETIRMLVVDDAPDADDLYRRPEKLAAAVQDALAKAVLERAGTSVSTYTGCPLRRR